MNRGYVDTPEGQIHYRTEGSGEPIVLLHQPPLSSEEYDFIIPVLAEKYQAIAMDMLGHGDSDDPPDYNYEIEDYARNVVHFLDALGINKASIVGHHSGATVAVEVAAAYPPRVDRLVLSGCPVRVNQKAQETGKEPGPQLTDEKRDQLRIKEDGQLIMWKWNIYKNLVLPGTSPELIFKNFKIGLAKIDKVPDPDDYYALERAALMQYKITPRLGLIKSPTLLMSGEKGFAVDELDYTKELIPSCRTQVITNQGWYPGVENPVGFAQAVIEFLEKPEV